MIYRLDDRAARARARIVALVGTASTVAPALLVVVLVHKLGYASAAIAWAGGGALFALAIVRGFAEYARVSRRLAAFAATVDDDGVVVRGKSGEVRVAWREVVRAVEVGGALGGLRLVLEGDERIDVPRGGADFGELRAAIDARAKVGRGARRGRLVRIALGAAVVLAIFFVPFAMDDLVGRSRIAAVAVVAGVWGTLMLLRRR